MSDLVARGANPQTIRFQHDFNDRERDGSYRIWLQPGTRVTLYDGEGIEIECFLEYSQFVTVVPAPRGDAEPGCNTCGRSDGKRTAGCPECVNVWLR